MSEHAPSVRAKHRVDQSLGWLLAALMGVAVLNVLWQVFTRYVLHAPSAYTDELARYVLIWIGLLGGAYAAGRRMHLAIDLLPMRLHGRRRAALGVLIDTLIGAFALVVLVIGGSRLVALTLLLEQTSAALRVPLGYVYLVLPLSGGLIIFYSALFIADHVRQLRGRDARLDETDEPVSEAYARGTETAPADGSDRGAGLRA